MENNILRPPAAEIRARIGKVFADQTEGQRHIAAELPEAKALAGDHPSDITRDFFQMTVDIIRTLYESTADEAKLLILTEDVRATFRTSLTHVVYYTFPAWHLRPDMTDAEVLSAFDRVKDILDHPAPYGEDELARLSEAFRDKDRTKDFVMPLSTDAANYKAAIDNLRYYVLACASYAKHLDSFPAGHAFLKAASVLARGLKRVPLRFTTDEADEFLYLFDEGLDEVNIAGDYRCLTPWEKVLSDAQIVAPN